MEHVGRDEITNAPLESQRPQQGLMIVVAIVRIGIEKLVIVIVKRHSVITTMTYCAFLRGLLTPGLAATYDLQLFLRNDTQTGVAGAIATGTDYYRRNIGGAAIASLYDFSSSYPCSSRQARSSWLMPAHRVPQILASSGIGGTDAADFPPIRLDCRAKSPFLNISTGLGAQSVCLIFWRPAQHSVNGWPC